jgi:hypothetical protein
MGASECRGAVSVHFDRDVYVVTGPNQQITAHISIDADPSTPLDDAIAQGLYSMSLGLVYPGAKASVPGVADVAVPGELEFFGYNPGAFRQLMPGAAGVKGNVDQTATPLGLYHETRLATFTITNLAAAPDSYPLGLNFFNTVGPNEQFYLDGMGTVLDPQIMFGSARVVVVPEPGAGVVVSGALVLGLYNLRRRLTGTWRPAGGRATGKSIRHSDQCLRGSGSQVSKGVSFYVAPHTFSQEKAIESTTDDPQKTISSAGGGSYSGHSRTSRCRVTLAGF